MSLGLDANRLAIDRVYLNECTVKAYQERARLKNKRDAMGDALSSGHVKWVRQYPANPPSREKKGSLCYQLSR
jgi:hypothetical protein